MQLVESTPGWVQSMYAWWPSALTVTMFVCMGIPLGLMLWRLYLQARMRLGGYGPVSLVTEDGVRRERSVAGERATWRALMWVALVVLGSRLLLYGWAWAADCVKTGRWVDPLASFPKLWVQWDAYHYLKISNQWYLSEAAAALQKSTQNDYLMLVFFPLFPLLVRALKSVFGDALLAATVLNTLCTMGVGCVLYAMVTRLYGRSKARWALAYLLLNPMAIFLAAPYPEALFLLTTLLAVDAANRRRYGLAGFFGALSAYARLLGVVVLGLILLEGVQHWLEQRGRRAPMTGLTARVLGGSALVLAGTAGYLLLNWQVAGDAFRFLVYQRDNWGQEFRGFWYSARITGLWMLGDMADEAFLGTWVPQMVAMITVPLLLTASQRRLPLPMVAYAWVYLFAALAPSWLLSGARYLMVLAVLPVMQVQASHRRWFHWAFCSLQGMLLLLYTFLYTVERSVL